MRKHAGAGTLSWGFTKAACAMATAGDKEGEVSQSWEEPARPVVTILQTFSTGKSHLCCTPEDSSSWFPQPETPKHEKSRCTELHPSAQVSAHAHTTLISWAHSSCKLQKAPRISSQVDFLDKNSNSW